MSAGPRRSPSRWPRPVARALACAALLGAACDRAPATGPTELPAGDALAPAAADAGSAAPRADGPALVRAACLSCHGEQLLAQQRLPKERWAATVKKMVGWGAALQPADSEVLVAHLASRYGPEAGPFAPALVPAERAAAALAPQADEAAGAAARGARLFAERCASCHGADARGLPALGLNLVERPLLYRAADVAAVVRGGRGSMPAQPATSAAELADLLAHLRTLRLP